MDLSRATRKEFLSLSNRFFELGMSRFQERHYSAATKHFENAWKNCEEFDPQRHLYLSYIGLCNVMCGNEHTISACREAAANETQLVDVFYNVALAEFHLNHRRRAFCAIHQGLKIDPTSRLLFGLLKQLDTRRDPALPFLPRHAWINKLLGRISYKIRQPRIFRAIEHHQTARTIC
jgi:tetratricopeptide (TPR) repeat protein